MLHIVKPFQYLLHAIDLWMYSKWWKGAHGSAFPAAHCAFPTHQSKTKGQAMTRCATHVALDGVAYIPASLETRQWNGNTIRLSGMLGRTCNICCTRNLKHTKSVDLVATDIECS